LKRSELAKKRNKKFGVSGFPDKIIIAIIALLLFLGLILVYDSSVIVASAEPFNDPFHFFKLQLLWIIFGLIAGYIAYRIDYHLYPKFISLVLIGNVILLVVVLII